MGEVHIRLLKGSSANGLALVANLSEQLLLVPVLLAAWSVTTYGEWLLLNTIPTYLLLMGLGILTSTSNELARLGSLGEEKITSHFFRTLTAFFLRWSVLIGLLATPFLYFIPFHSLFDFQSFSNLETQLVLLFLGINAVVSINTLSLFTGFRVRHKYHLALMIRAGFIFVRLTFVFFLVSVFEQGAPTAAFIMLVTGVVEYCTTWFLLRKENLTPSFQIFTTKSSVLRPHLIGGLEYMMFPLAQTFSLQGMVLLVGALYDPVTVAIFATHRTLTRLTSSVINLAVAPMTNEAGLLNAQADALLVTKLTLSITRITFWVSLIFAIILFSLGRYIFELWTNGQIPFGEHLFGLLIAVTVFEAIWQGAATVRMGSNRHRPLAWGYITVSLAALLGAYFLGSYFEVSMVVIPIVGANILMCVLTILTTAPILNISSTYFLSFILLPPVAELRELRKRFMGGGFF